MFFCLPAAASAQLLISEVFYDASGGDAGKVFVELFGTPGMDLTGLLLQGVNGNDGKVYRSLSLSGVIPADGVFVIADDDGSGSTRVAGADLVADIDLQNGPDSLQLLDGGRLLDAVGYGDFSGMIFAGLGAAAPDVPAGSSLARFANSGDNLADFQVLATPTPGTSNLSAVPLPAAFWLFGSGLALLGARLRSRSAP
ncbi:lamin tail domain-containing protein [Thiohalobacter sp. IOR34]|uniref:lamin tail domain-containing protein n=1 Tax=Thiohalobacter sp. IOR34 TaxID=3057176 RepID=UPI0025B153C8|nr:lamin tail domain-containing protein [Thiohalobacter sp. IOR34]WJW75748.1 lamin tail domain-containing protein [Thiohalobacter sp. IOR34]